MTSALIKSCRRRKKLFHKKQRKKDPVVDEEYRKLKNKLNHLIDIAEENYKAERFRKSEGNSGKTWKTINEYLGRNKKQNEIPNEIIENDIKHKKSQDILNALNKSFVRKGPKLASDIPQSQKNFKEFLGPRIQNAFTLDPISVSEIIDIVHKFDASKSAGHDGIPAKILKWSIPTIAPILKDIFNSFILNGTYPEEFKIARVVALHKKGPKNIADNYRPISILTQLNKIFEKLIHERLMNFLIEQNVLTPRQFGYRKKHNTIHGVLNLIEEIKNTLDDKKVCSTLFIDLKGAFDTIDIDILLEKLEHYGVRGTALGLFKSYLTNRKQYIQYGDVKSILLEILCGVPQGSVLGPLLFIFYINDLSKCTTCSTSLYADDAAFLAAARSVIDLQHQFNQECIKILDWMNANKLTLNYSKTKCMLFSRKTRDLNTIQIVINSNPIECVSTFKYLGVIIDEKLCWNAHTKYLISKLSQASGAIYNLRKTVSRKTLLTIYNGLVGSHLNYGVLIWGSAKECILKNLQVSQNKIVRAMTFSPITKNISKLLKSLRIMNVKEIYDFEVAKFMYNMYNENLPEVFTNYVSAIEHTYSTRHRLRSHYELSTPNSDLGKTSVKYYGVKIWSSLSKELQDVATLNSFKDNYKKILFDH